jgi:DNA-binding beta-propeller fold protein YncE
MKTGHSGLQDREKLDDPAEPESAWEEVLMKWQKFWCGVGALAGLAGVMLLNGCGGGGANTVTVTISPSSVVLVTTQTQTFTATVGGSTDLTVVWSCAYTTTTSTTSSSGTVTTTTSTASPCTAATGNIPASSTDTTVTFTAPTKFPNSLSGLVITLTATSNADKKKTGTATIAIDSGIRITVTPATASVPTSESQQFIAGQTNDPIPNDVTWLVTQQASTSTTLLPQALTCAPGCGMVDASGNYTAPSAVPTTAALTLVATSKLDTSEFGAATVTIVQGGPISFNGLSPTVLPLGGIFEDLYVEAPNVSSKSGYNITRPDGTPISLPAQQFKVVFPEPTTTVTSPTSTGARIRLTPKELTQVGTYKVSITDPAQKVAGGPFSFQVIAVQPVISSTAPHDVPEGTLAGAFTVNGGYFGGGVGSPPVSPFVSVVFQGTALTINQAVSGARQLASSFTGANSGLPGLYPVSVVNNNVAAPTPKSAVGNLAVFPDFEMSDPATLLPGATATGTTPSAIAIDNTLNVAVVAQAGANNVQFYSIAAGSLTPLGAAVPVGTLPTSVAIDQTRHRAYVVNFGSKSVTILQIPTPPGTPSATPLATIDMSGMIPPTASTNSTNPPPSPYSIGVDADTNLGLVAFGSTNVGFIVNLFLTGIDTGTPSSPSTCFTTSPVQHLPCATSSVTLPTGKYPGIAMEPHVHLAFVTPGAVGVGSGPLSVVDLTQANGKTQIASASRSSNLVTVTTTVAHNLNAGNPGVVLINGVPNGTAGTVFNGAYAVVAVVDSLHFQYVETAPDDTTTGNATSFAFYGSQDLSFTVSSSLQGIAINPITRTAAAADPNADGVTGPQIELINSLDESVSSITLNAGCVVMAPPYNTNCSAPELGATNVAFQPYSNVLVSFNPVRNEVSLLDPVRLGRYFLQSTGASTGTKSITAADGTILTISGPVAVDPDPGRNQAFIVNSGSNNIQIMNLGHIKTAHISELILTAGNIPGTQLRQATLTSTATLTGVRVLGTGFDTGSQVRLDGVALPGANIHFVTSNEIDVDIPASFLTGPRRYALDLINSAGVQSNATDFSVFQSINVSKNCSASATPQPGAVAIDRTRDLAIVANTGCNTVSIIDVNPTVNGAANPTFGTVIRTVSVGATPTGVAVSSRLGIAVVTNNAAGTASIIDVRTPGAAKEIVPDVTVGTNPAGVAIDDDNGAAVIANTGSNTASVINLNPLFASTVATTLTATTVATNSTPISVAIDPDRGTNSNGLAVVTTASVSNSSSGASTVGSADLIDLGAATPVKTTSSGLASFTATPTGVAFDSAVSPAVFYISSSEGNAILTYNPDSGTALATQVGINPTSLAYNYETGTILTVNTISNTLSVVDTLSSPFKTVETLGLSGSPEFSLAVHPRTNLVVLTDQSNNRVLLVPALN